MHERICDGRREYGDTTRNAYLSIAYAAHTTPKRHTHALSTETNHKYMLDTPFVTSKGKKEQQMQIM